MEFLTKTRPPKLPPSLFAGSIRLKAVEVKARATGLDSLTYQKLLREYPKGCRDYVCKNGILNCKRHKSGTKPIIGQTYQYLYPEHPKLLYTKCLLGGDDPNNFPLRHIQKATPFLLMDYQKDTDPTPAYLSTIFWNPDINTDDAGEATFKFYTSDLKAVYKIVIQGFDMENLEAIYGKKKFVVQ